MRNPISELLVLSAPALAALIAELMVFLAVVRAVKLPQPPAMEAEKRCYLLIRFLHMIIQDSVHPLPNRCFLVGKKNKVSFANGP